MSIRRERKDAIEHNRLILRTAKALFKEHGVNSVSMHQIAKTAGIGQATLYRRYAHKGDLCSDILQDYSQKLMDQITSYLQENTHITASERLGGVIAHWVDTIEEKSDLIVTMESKMRCDDQRSNFFHSPLYVFIRDRITELLNEHHRDNSQSSLVSEFRAHAIICSMSPVGYFHIKLEKSLTKEQMKQLFREAIML